MQVRFLNFFAEEVKRKVRTTQDVQQSSEISIVQEAGKHLRKTKLYEL